MQPQPLPGQVFVRPGIDDRPDYEKTLTEETKAVSYTHLTLPTTPYV